MKRIISMLLVLVLLVALSATAFAAGSPTGDGKQAQAQGQNGFVVYANDGKGTRVPSRDVTKLFIHQADKLDASDKASFESGYEAAKKMEDKIVRNVFWLDIADEYKTDFDHCNYYFTLHGRNVEVFVNGNKMDVVSYGGGQYVAKLTEFGTVVITTH